MLLITFYRFFQSPLMRFLFLYQESRSKEDKPWQAIMMSGKRDTIKFDYDKIKDSNLFLAAYADGWLAVESAFLFFRVREL